MKNRLTLLIGVIVVMVLFAYMLFYQVRYDQWAVHSRFGKTDESSVKDVAGLYFKLPAPIDRVRTYPKQIQILSNAPMEQTTKDDRTVILRTAVEWRIKEPLAFFKTLRTTAKAEQEMAPIVRDVQSVFSNYNFSDMVNPDPAKTKLKQMELDATRGLGDRVQDAGYGIEIIRVGIRRIAVSETITQSVTTRMKETRERLAESARQEGEAEARKITSRAHGISKQILAFADQRAKAIQTEGDVEAAQRYDVFKQEPKLAFFLRWIEALPEILKHRTTYMISLQDILSPERLAGLLDGGGWLEESKMSSRQTSQDNAK